MLFGVLVVVGWACANWLLLRPDHITIDWNGGRQADTQTIAKYLASPGATLLWPQIAWSGDGPGYVETELQLYTALIAALMGVFGRAEWLGQLISLLSMVGTAVVLWQHLDKRYGVLGACVAVLSFLAQRTTVHLSSVVMPDAFALFAYVTAWSAIHRYATTPRARELMIFALVGCVAMMQKPTMAQLGISSFVLMALTSGSRLRDYRLWLAWASMLVIFACYLVHAHHLYVEYGNTFGVLFGREGKAPHLRHLFMPSVLFGALANLLRWGYGHVGAVALLALIVRRRVEPEHVALAVGNVIMTLLALRYTSQDAGNYYLAPSTLLASCAVASMTRDIADSVGERGKQLAFVALGTIFALQFARNAEVRWSDAHYVDGEVAAVVATGKQLRELADPGDLVVVRTPHSAQRDTFWDTDPNTGDPRVFYLSNTHGWVLGRDQVDTALLRTAAAHGARFFADSAAEPDPRLESALSQYGEIVWSAGPLGRIWRLKQPPVAAASQN